MECIYVKYNRERLPKFQTQTAIYKEDGIYFVRKSSISNESLSHIRQIYENYLFLKDNRINAVKAYIKQDDNKSIYFEYIDGISFEKQLFTKLINKDKKGFFSILKEYKDFLSSLAKSSVKVSIPSKEFKEIFGVDISFSNSLLCTNLGLIDLLFENIIKNESGIICIIDYEWLFKFEIPISFIAYRSINEFFVKYMEYLYNFTDISEVFSFFDIEKEELNLFEIMENRFQNYVFGINKPYRLSPKYEKSNESLNSIILINQKYKDLVVSQNKRIEELGAWGRWQDEEIAKRDKTIIAQNDRIEELSAWGRQLDEEIKEKDINILSQTARIEELNKLICSLENAINEKTEIINSFENEISRLQQTIETLKKASEEALGKREEYLNALKAKENELSKIHNSRGWRYLLKIYKAEDMLLPLHSKRREALKSIYFLFRNLKLILKHINSENIKKLYTYARTESPGRVFNHIKSYLSRYKPIPKMKIKLFEPAGNYERIIFKHTSNPLVSIIIPVYNQWGFTYSCLRSISENTADIEYEIIIADDVSDDETRNISKYIENIKVIRNKQNQGFLRNCNNAAKYAKGKYILFLNNDTNVQEGWLKPLVDLIEKDSKIGMVGSKLVYADGRLQEAGGIIWNDASGWNYGRFDDPEKPEYNYVKEVDYISGASIMIRADLWKQIGGFDIRYVPAYFEDSDLAFEVRKHGYKVVFQPKSIVVHFEGISHGTDADTGIKSYQIQNRSKFIEKWKDTLEKEQFANGQNVFQARDRSRNKKTILVIDHYVPHYDKDAGSRTTYQYLKLFLKMGLNVKFIGDNYYKHEPYTNELQQLGIEILYGVWYSENWKQWLKDQSAYIDYVYLNRPHISIKYIDFIKQNLKAKIIYYGHDLHYLREKREYELTKNKDLIKSVEDWKKVEYQLFEKADAVYYPSYVEIDEIKKDFSNINAKPIPAYIFYNLETVREYIPENRRDIMFVGGFSHKPNIDAVMWFVKDVFPKVLSMIPEIKFYIIGSNPTDEIIRMASENIIVTGFVTDEQLDSYYDTCRLNIVPLRYGAGVKGKVVESMYKQIPVITTEIGAEGLIGIEKCIKVCNCDEKFADELINLYNDIRGLKQLSERARLYVAEHFSEKRALEIIKEDIKA